MNDQKKAYLYTLAAILFWSVVGSVLKITLRYTDFLSLLFFSSLFSALSLFVILLFQRKIRKLAEFSCKDFLHSAFLGFLNPFLYYTVLLKAYDMLLAQEAGTLNYIWPIVLVIFSVFILKQKISLLSFFAIIISFSGTVIIGTQGNIFRLEFNNPVGVALALSSAVFWSLYWIINMKDKKDEIVRLFVNFIFGLIYISITIFLTTGLKMPTIKGLGGAAYIGLFEMGITYVIWLKALKLSKTTARVSNLIFVSPFLSLIFIRIFVGEHILISTITGIVLIIGGIILQRYSAKIEKSVN